MKIKYYRCYMNIFDNKIYFDMAEYEGVEKPNTIKTNTGIIRKNNLNYCEKNGDGIRMVTLNSNKEEVYKRMFDSLIYDVERNINNTKNTLKHYEEKLIFLREQEVIYE